MLRLCNLYAMEKDINKYVFTMCGKHMLSASTEKKRLKKRSKPTLIKYGNRVSES